MFWKKKEKYDTIDSSIVGYRSILTGKTDVESDVLRRFITHNIIERMLKNAYTNHDGTKVRIAKNGIEIKYKNRWYYPYLEGDTFEFHTHLNLGFLGIASREYASLFEAFRKRIYPYNQFRVEPVGNDSVNILNIYILSIPKADKIITEVIHARRIISNNYMDERVDEYIRTNYEHMKAKYPNMKETE